MLCAAELILILQCMYSLFLSFLHLLVQMKKKKLALSLPDQLQPAAKKCVIIPKASRHRPLKLPLLRWHFTSPVRLKTLNNRISIALDILDIANHITATVHNKLQSQPEGAREQQTHNIHKIQGFEWPQAKTYM